MLRLGIDLGGTKTEVIVLSDAGRELLRSRIDTPQGDYGATLRALVTLIDKAEAEVGERCSIGIGTPGSLSAHTGLMRNSNSVCLNGRPVKHDIEALLGRDIRVANDANCFALSEAVDGAGAGADVVFGVIVGTGVGGGIVVEGKVLRGANAISGEWGHIPLPGMEGESDAPRPCYCGRKGCVETWLSGPAMAQDHVLHGGSPLSPQQIVERAASNVLCEATLQRYATRLARALATVINIVDPEVIVLGGGLSNIARLYDAVPQLWLPHVFSEHVDTRLVRNHHGDSSGVRGAAWLWN